MEDDDFKSFKDGVRKIENGYVVTRLGGEIYKQNLPEALKELRYALDAIEKEFGGNKPSVPQTSKPPVGVR